MIGKINMKRRFYLKVVVSKFLEDYYGEPMDEKLVALLRSRIESRNNHNDEFQVKLVGGVIKVLHLNEEICTIN